MRQWLEHKRASPEIVHFLLEKLLVKGGEWEFGYFQLVSNRSAVASLYIDRSVSDVTFLCIVLVALLYF